VQNYEKSIQFARLPIEIVIANNEERIAWQSGVNSGNPLCLFYCASFLKINGGKIHFELKFIGRYLHKNTNNSI